MAKILGYARTSTELQTPALQLDALAAAGCDRVWTDQASGAVTARPALEAMLDYARTGDVVTVWRLDRLGRSVRHLVDVVGLLEKEGIQFRSLTEGIDTTTPNGRLTFHIFAAVAEFESDLIRARTNAGLAAARSRGRVGGRPTVMTSEKRTGADDLLSRPGATVTSVARALGVSRTTIYRHITASRTELPARHAE